MSKLSCAMSVGLLSIGLSCWSPVASLSGQDAPAAEVAAAEVSSDGVSIRTLGPVEKLQGGFQFTEGPTPALAGPGESVGLYFTDIPADQILHWQAGQKAVPLIEPAGHANGLLMEAGGRLVACQMDGQVVVYDLQTKKLETLAASYQGKRFNAPNDLIIDSVGGVYFTDPLFRAPEPLPQGVQAVYYITADRQVVRVTDDLPAPNGIGLSPDGDKLYVIPSRSAEMMVYQVLAPGKLGPGKVFCRLRQTSDNGNSGGDGMVVDTGGNIYITADTGVQVFDREGTYLTTIEFPEQPANVTFGGVERDELFVTARTGLYRVKVSATGLPPGRLSPGTLATTPPESN
ncbi:SMP-30/gluconolactonase/LRE family protein [Planctomycetaceae bacterium SH139]